MAAAGDTPREPGEERDAINVLLQRRKPLEQRQIRASQRKVDQFVSAVNRVAPTAVKPMKRVLHLLPLEAGRHHVVRPESIVDDYENEPHRFRTAIGFGMHP